MSLARTSALTEFKAFIVSIMGVSNGYNGVRGVDRIVKILLADVSCFVKIYGRTVVMDFNPTGRHISFYNS